MLMCAPHNKQQEREKRRKEKNHLCTILTHKQESTERNTAQRFSLLCLHFLAMTDLSSIATAFKDNPPLRRLPRLNLALIRRILLVDKDAELRQIATKNEKQNAAPTIIDFVLFYQSISSWKKKEEGTIPLCISDELFFLQYHCRPDGDGGWFSSGGRCC
jgi:hypothetical protein